MVMKGSVPERMSSLGKSQLLSELGRKVAREKKQQQPQLTNYKEEAFLFH